MIIYTHLCKSLHHLKCVGRISPFLSSFNSIRCISCNASDDQHSFVVTYLTNSCGVSPNSALSISKSLNFKTSDQPDSVLACLKKNGFSKPQILKIIQTRPTVLLSNPEKTLLPKIEFFHSKGFSSLVTVKVLSVCPQILHSSLEKRLIPAFSAIKSILRDDDLVIRAITRSPNILLSHLYFYVIPNIKILRDNGFPESSIAWFLVYHPRDLFTSSDSLTKSIDKVKELGLKPSQKIFSIAIQVMRSLSKSAWERKSDIYKKWGWSELEILAAFKKFPGCMATSEKKITAMMDYYINKMGLDSSYIARSPSLIGFSFEKRVVPRCSVIQVLLSKGLVTSTSLSSRLNITEEVFLCRFVIPYQKEIPHLLKLYQKKLNDPN
ncbi:transcription termination factor MTERF6, chloroplastic/mitochondrial-like [Mercurialis annua]|uniref:transcription termination factor MTERF6, chloroplastic/mitochondrial-like n=1 Tax=Mercurialis annua TaxID=3986 RepID=UPI002160D3BB|nr:transcription termination factor MTERF6, chloroplastic/mitochondrial-like [Mercurialis annua]